MQCGDNRVHRLGGGLVIGPDAAIVIQAMAMAQFAAAARQPGGSAFNLPVGAGGFTPLQPQHRNSAYEP